MPCSGLEHTDMPCKGRDGPAAKAATGRMQPSDDAYALSTKTHCQQSFNGGL